MLAAMWLLTMAATRQELTTTQQKLLSHYTNNDPVWALLAKAPVSENKERGILEVAFPAEIRAMQGRTLQVTGFMTPMEAKPYTRHFAVVRRDPTCPFCPPSAANEAVEVITDRPIPLVEAEVAVKGKLVLISDSRNGLFFGLEHADWALKSPATRR